MRRRSFLGTAVAASLAAVGGCLGDGDAGPPPVPGDRPPEVYRPSHVARAVRVATRRAGPYAVTVAYSAPTRFWIVEGNHTERRSVRSEHDLHLMATVRDAETGTVLPDTGVTMAVAREGVVSQEVVYPMLSQRMGFHYGDNVALEGPGSYEVRVDVAGTAIRRTGAFAGRFEDHESATVGLEFDPDAVPDYARPADAGRPGAVEPRGGVGAPPVESLPGRVLATDEADGVRYVVVAREPPSGLGGDDEGDAERYLAVSARTRHNGLVVPAAGLAGRLERDGRTVHESALGRALDPDLGYHYGALVPEPRAGDRLALRVTTPPQVARHEGYETAFTDPVELALALD